MARWKGGSVRRGDGKLDGVDLKGTRPTDEGFYTKINHCCRQDERDGHDQTCIAGISADEQQKGKQYPDNAGVAELCDKAENKIKHIAAHMCLNPE